MPRVPRVVPQWKTDTARAWIALRTRVFSKALRLAQIIALPTLVVVVTGDPIHLIG